MPYQDSYGIGSMLGIQNTPETAAAAPGDPIVVPTAPELPDVSIHEAGPSSDTTRTKFDPKYTEQIQNQASAVDAEIQHTADQGIINTQKAQGTETAAGEALGESDRFLKERKEGIDAADAEVKAKMDASAERRKQLEAASKDRVTSLWEDKGKPAQLFSIFMTGLSEMSNIRAGGKYGDSPLQHYFDKALEDDQKKKLARFEDSKLFQELSDKDVEAARRAKVDKLTEIKDEHSVMIDNLIKKAQAYASKLGTQEALVKANNEIALLQERKAKDLGEIYKELSSKTVSHSGDTSTTTNIKKAPGEKSAGGAEVDKRQAHLEAEKATKEIATIAEKNPEAVKEFQDRMREWNVRQKNEKVPIAGPLVGAAMQAFGASTERDELFNDASPEAKRLYEQYNTTVGARARARGGPITPDDERAINDTLGFLAKTPAEIAKSSRGYSESEARARASLETNVKFKDVATSPEQKEATKEAALSNLIRVTSVKGVGKAAILEMAERAKAAGVDPSTVDGLVKKARR